jgi:hypothetical protein
MRVMQTDPLAAAKAPDWLGIHCVACFHVEDGRFCLRAERWDGHYTIGGRGPIHKYVSLEDLLRQTRADALRYVADKLTKHTGDWQSVIADLQYEADKLSNS